MPFQSGPETALFTTVVMEQPVNVGPADFFRGRPLATSSFLLLVAMPLLRVFLSFRFKTLDQLGRDHNMMLGPSQGIVDVGDDLRIHIELR